MRSSSSGHGRQAGQPARGELRRALDRRHVVAAEPKRERLALGLGIHFEVAHGVVLALVRHPPFAEQAAHQLQTFVHHLAALSLGREPRCPGGELLAIGADAQRQDQPAA